VAAQARRTLGRTVVVFVAAMATALTWGGLSFTGVALAADPASGATLVRHDQSDAAISYSGAWATTKKAAAQGGRYARAAGAGSSVNIAFTGTRLDWIATKDTGAGAADVYLDGAFAQTVTLTSPTAAYQQDVWSTGTLAQGVHTVRIVRSASSAAGAYITIDAADVAGTLATCQWAEEGSSLLAYLGSWRPVADASFAAGAGFYSNSAGTSVTVSFTGTSLAWLGEKSWTGGIAKVTLDGAQTFSVDLYSPSPLYQQSLWDTGQLTAGAHTLKIEWTGTSNSSSYGTYVNVDGFLVTGTLAQAYVWHRFEESDARLLYWGTWTQASDSEASGGSDRKAAAGQGKLTVTFTGEQLDWIATTGPGFAFADVSVDNGPAELVSLFGTETFSQQKVWSTGRLPAGTHTVQISRDACSAQNTVIDIDALDVLGTLPWTTALTSLRIEWAEQRLSDLSYRPGKIDGTIDSRARAAIIAFEKWEGLPRNGKLTADVFSRLQTAARPAPSKKSGSGTWIEVDKAKQVLLYCKNGAVVWTLPVATGSPSVGIVTPSGTFRILRKTLETNPRWHPMYLRPHSVLAIHGYPSVPTHRASHGCVRTEPFDQRDLYPLIPVGTYVYIY
jgi:hypothetical protein